LCRLILKIQMKKSLLLLVLFSTLTIFSQDNLKKYKFNFQFDNRYSNIRNYKITIFGAKMGIQYKNLTRFGVGASFIVSPVDITGTLQVRIKKKLVNENTEEKISFWYFSVYNDWIFYKTKHWECFATEQIGYGKPVYVYQVNNATVREEDIPLYVNEISGQVNYKIFSWMGLGAGLGYRNIWNGGSEVKDTFNAPIYIARLIIYPESILKK